MDNRRSPSPSPQPSNSSSQSRRQRSRSRSRSRSPSNRTTMSTMSHQTCVSKKSDSSSKSGDGQATTTTTESSQLQASASSLPVFGDATAANPLFPGGMTPMPMTAFGGQMMQMQMPQGVMPVPVMMVPSNMFAPSNMFTPFATPATTPLTVTPNLVNAANKVNRELFVGNTPPGISEQLLIQFMNGAMQRTKLCATDRNAVISCRLNAKFAFIECATPDDADKALNLNGIPFMGMNLRVSRPSKYAGPHVPSKTWQELTGLPVTTTMMGTSPAGATRTGGAAAPSAADDKIHRELYIGNTTSEMTESSLTDFLGKALEHVGLTKQPGNPITACQISGKYAFAEFRSVEETSNALNLNNIPFMGVQLRVSRPSKYAGPDTPHLNWEDILSKCMSGELKLKEEVESLRPKPTRVVQLKNMLTADDLESDEDYNEVLEETKEECSEFGRLKNIIIPRTGVGSTKIFLEYETMDDAARAIQALAGRTFDGRTIDAGFMDETKYQNRDYSD